MKKQVFIFLKNLVWIDLNNKLNSCLKRHTAKPPKNKRRKVKIRSTYNNTNYLKQNPKG